VIMDNCHKVPILIVDDRPENLISLEAILNDMELDCDGSVRQ
jgi:hypothetical protein